MMHLVSCFTPNYYYRTHTWFDSVGCLSCPVTVVLVNFNERTDKDGVLENKLKKEYNSITFKKLELSKSHSHLMIQGGDFLDAVDCSENDLICLCDMDVTFQRDFTESELEALEKALVDKRSIGVYWNGGLLDTLVYEGMRLELDENWINKYSQKIQHQPCMNCGVMIATKSVFGEVRKLYESSCQEFYEATSHRSRCQYLINWCWHKLGIKVHLLPPQLHQHGHFGKPSIVDKVNGKYCVNGKEVVICHAL